MFVHSSGQDIPPIVFSAARLTDTSRLTQDTQIHTRLPRKDRQRTHKAWRKK